MGICVKKQIFTRSDPFCIRLVSSLAYCTGIFIINRLCDVWISLCNGLLLGGKQRRGAICALFKQCGFCIEGFECSGLKDYKKSSWRMLKNLVGSFILSRFREGYHARGL